MSESDSSWPSDGGNPAGDGGPTPPEEQRPAGTPPPPAPPPAPTGGPPPAPRAGADASADLGIRFGARIIDFVVLWIVSLLIVVPLFIGMIFAEAGGVSMLGSGGGLGVSLVSGILIVAIYLAYFVFMDTRFGWTLGKKLLNLEVRGAAGGLPSVEESLKRNAWIALQVIPFIGWLLQLGAAIYIAVTINSDAANNGWHDAFAGGTRVVRTT